MHYYVTDENINLVKTEMFALDQIDDVVPGCEVWQFEHTNGQAGQFIVFPKDGRAGICFGGDSEWGEWDNQKRTLRLDEYDIDGEPICYDDSGNRIPYEEC